MPKINIGLPICIDEEKLLLEISNYNNIIAAGVIPDSVLPVLSSNPNSEIVPVQRDIHPHDGGIHF